jgi:hypothetical protein
MPTHLNQYGLVACSASVPFTLELAQVQLGITIEMTDPVQLLDAVRCEVDRVGVYQGCLLFCLTDEFQFFMEPPTDFATRVITSATDGLGCAVYYYSIPDLFGYAYFKHGRMQRVHFGEHDKEWANAGKQMDFEDEWSKESSINALTEQVLGVQLPFLLDKEIQMFRFIFPSSE